MTVKRKRRIEKRKKSKWKINETNLIRAEQKNARKEKSKRGRNIKKNERKRSRNVYRMKNSKKKSKIKNGLLVQRKETSRKAHLMRKARAREAKLCSTLYAQKYKNIYIYI